MTTPAFTHSPLTNTGCNDANKVNRNMRDIVAWLTDGTFDLTIGSLTAPVATLDHLQFSTSPTGATGAEGELAWNAVDGTLNLGMSGGDISMQIGQEMFIKVENKTVATILNGSVVYISGRTGQWPEISLAKSDSITTSKVLGVTTQDIAKNGSGYVTILGYVRKIKTNYTGSGIWGTNWAAGDILYVSKTSAGTLTNVEPTAPHYSDIVGTVGIVHGTLGSILITLDRAKTLENLNDVNGTTLATSGQFPVWNDTAKYFDFNYNINDYSLTTHRHYQLYESDYGSVAVDIDSLGNVGISTSIPGSYYAKKLVVDCLNSDGDGITIKSKSSGVGYLLFADGTSGSEAYRGQIAYNHSTDMLSIGSGGGTPTIYVDASNRVGIVNATPAASIDVVGTSRFGDSSTNYTNFDTTGHQTMVGTAKPWRDELGDALGIKVQGVGVAANPTEGTQEFATNAHLEDYLYKNVQLNHDKDLSSSISPHIHWFQENSATPNFLLQYRWQINGGTKTTPWIDRKCITNAYTYTTGTLNQISEASAITVPVGTTLSDIVQFRIVRDTANSSTTFVGADAYSAVAGILSFDSHFQINSLGSTDEYTK